MTTETFQVLMAAAAEAILGQSAATIWHSQIEFLQSGDGDEYFRKLDAGLKAHISSLGNLMI